MIGYKTMSIQNENNYNTKNDTMVNTENQTDNTELHGSEHTPTIYAERVTNIAGLNINNSFISSFFVLLVIITFSLLIKNKIKKIPSKIQIILEILIEKTLELCDNVTNNRKKTNQIFPIVISLFLFILINNWFGLLPGIGSIGFYENQAFVPFLRGGTADINTTLALALSSVIGANIFGIISIGGWNYFNKFINIKELVHGAKVIRKEPSSIIVSPIKFFVGILEIIGEFAKVTSLSFRLFGNIFAGEVLLASMAAIFAFVLPIPFIFLEVLVGFIQAFIFSMLVLVYFNIASEDHNTQH